jgi:hypothetical protein
MKLVLGPLEGYLRIRTLMCGSCVLELGSTTRFSALQVPHSQTSPGIRNPFSARFTASGEHLATCRFSQRASGNYEARPVLSVAMTLNHREPLIIALVFRIASAAAGQPFPTPLEEQVRTRNQRADHCHSSQSRISFVARNACPTATSSMAMGSASVLAIAMRPNGFRPSRQMFTLSGDSPPSNVAVSSLEA